MFEMVMLRMIQKTIMKQFALNQVIKYLDSWTGRVKDIWGMTKIHRWKLTWGFDITKLHGSLSEPPIIP